MTGLLIHDAGEQKLFKRAVPLVRPCEVLLDVGAGIRPQRMLACRRHLCVEPHGEYADILAGAGFEVIRATAVRALEELQEPVDSIVAIDVIEHMEREEGEKFLGLALQRARQQIVIFTPLGFMPQDGGREGDMRTDPWGLQGQHWQRHRSAWTPYDFPGWRCLMDRKFNSGAGAFFAIHG